MKKLDILRNVLIESIVPAGAMEIDVKSWSGSRLELIAPLSANVNDKGIGFAGSIYSLAVLCGWGTVFQLLQDNGFSADIAVFKSSCDFMIPAMEDMTAVCTISEEVKMVLLNSFTKKGRGKAELEVEVFSGGIKCSSFSAKYAIRPKNSIGAV